MLTWFIECCFSLQEAEMKIEFMARRGLLLQHQKRKFNTGKRRASMFGKYLLIPIEATLILALIFSTASAGSDVQLSRGQTVYVPVYSHIYRGNREQPFLLTATISIRNTDARNVITILAVDYYDSDGKFLKNYLEGPGNIKGFGSIRYVVKESDTTGGSGAKFLVKWKSAHEVSPPIIESIMIGTQTQQGISFTSRGQVIQEGTE
jgi:hypothetical protein